MKPAPALPTGLAMSPTAATTVTQKPKAKSSIWAPPRPGSRKRKDGPSTSSAAVAGPSGTSGPSSSQSSFATSSQSGAPTLQGSSSSLAIDLTSPAKGKANVKKEEEGNEPRPPADVIEGGLVKQEREYEDEAQQEAAADPEEDVFFVRTQGEVVGIQHYHGLVGEGERVVLVRSVSASSSAQACRCAF